MTVRNVERLDFDGRVTARADQLDAFDGFRSTNTDFIKELTIILVARGRDTVADFTDEIFFGNFNAVEIVGSADNDTIFATTNDDRLSGQGGVNTVSYANGTASGVRVDLATPFSQDTFAPGLGQSARASGTDLLTDFANLIGSRFGDILRGTNPGDAGDKGANRIEGGGGNDTIFGRGGNDSLLGASGRDKLNGDGGSDRIDGGTGNDIVTGNAGADRFVFAGKFGRDTVTDFSLGDGDTIDLSDRNLRFNALTIRQDDDDAVIVIGKNRITLADIQADDLTAADFRL
jgi:serralysin